MRLVRLGDSVYLGSLLPNQVDQNLASIVKGVDTAKINYYAAVVIALILAVLILILALVFWLVGTRNRLAELRNQVQHLWSDVDLQLQRRDDILLSRLAEGGYPRSVMDEVKQACQEAVASRQAIWQKGGPIRASLQTLAQQEGHLLHVAGQLDSSGELQQSEQDLQSAIAAYNEAAQHYNQRIGQAPAAWLRQSGGHQIVELFRVQVSTTQLTSV